MVRLPVVYLASQIKGASSALLMVCCGPAKGEETEPMGNTPLEVSRATRDQARRLNNTWP
eukprot:11887278-Prorocentrum_lima.AAC.1